MATVTTVVSHGVLQLDLSELCDLIAARSSLARAEIVSAECYVQRIGLINHRFLILHLRREGRKDIYLRIDRRAARDVSLTELVWASGQTHAQDEVCIRFVPLRMRAPEPHETHPVPGYIVAKQGKTIGTWVAKSRKPFAIRDVAHVGRSSTVSQRHCRRARGVQSMAGADFPGSHRSLSLCSPTCCTRKIAGFFVLWFNSIWRHPSIARFHSAV